MDADEYEKANNFVEPGRNRVFVGDEKTDIPMVSTLHIELLIGYAESSITNPSNLEYPWYGFWNRQLLDLAANMNTERCSQLVVHPQFHLQCNKGDFKLSPYDAGNDGDTSMDSIKSTETRPMRDVLQAIPDFAIVREYRTPIPANPQVVTTQPKAGKQEWTYRAAIPFLVEVKRAESRKFLRFGPQTPKTSIVREARSFLKHTNHEISSAFVGLEYQAHVLFATQKQQKAVVLIGASGIYWAYQIFHRKYFSTTRVFDRGQHEDFQVRDPTPVEGLKKEPDLAEGVVDSLPKDFKYVWVLLNMLQWTNN